MFDRLVERGSAVGAARVRRVIAQLGTSIELPKGVTLERSETGIVLIGRGLKLRFITDPRLRAIAALAQGLVR